MNQFIQESIRKEFLQMKLYRFTAPFKPKGWDYIYVGLWNRYVRNKFLLISIFIPTVMSLYFVLQGIDPRFLPFFLLIACYPLFSVGAFLLQIKKHFAVRSPIDTAMTKFTLMDNGILMEREGREMPELCHWDQYNMCYELKRYLILFKTDSLRLILDKNYMNPKEVEQIRTFILNHMPENKKVVYKKSAIF